MKIKTGNIYNTTKMMKQVKFIFLIPMFFYCAQLYSQTTTKYYDSNWQEVAKEKGYYYENQIKEGGVYHSVSYWSDSNQVFSKLNFSDSNFRKGTGTGLLFYRSGKIKDSLVYSDKGNLLSDDQFSESGKHELHAYYDEKEKDMKGERFDEKGNKIPGYFTYQKQAMFPGGANGWVTYLQTHLKADVPTRKKAPAGNYTVMISFLVDKQGKISEVKAESDPGYGTAEEAVRVIKNGPDWLPAIQNDKPVFYRQKQSITFQVIDAKR